MLLHMYIYILYIFDFGILRSGLSVKSFVALVQSRMEADASHQQVVLVKKQGLAVEYTKNEE